MQHHGVDYQVLPLPTNEPNKSFDLVFQVAEHLEKFKINRWAKSAWNPQVLRLHHCCSCVQYNACYHFDSTVCGCW